MLRFDGLKPTSELFGKVLVTLVANECSSPINDWSLEIDGKTDGIDFISSNFPEISLENETCREILSTTNQCCAIFEVDTKRYKNGNRTFSATGGGETAEISVSINNFQLSYRVLNKKLLGSKIIGVIPPNAELELTEEVAEFINTLPGKTGLIDLELFSINLFTKPLNGRDTILGETPIERVISLGSYHNKIIGDTIQITLSETAASCFMEEFANSNPTLIIKMDDQVLEKNIDVFDMKIFPATNTNISQGN